MLRSAFALALVSSQLVLAESARGTGSAELSDPEGDVVTTGPRHGLDLVKLAFDSDGTKLTISATTKGSLDELMGDDPVVMYVDADNKASTGVAAAGSGGARPGFELRVNLQVCSEYYSGMTSCSGAVATDGLTNVYAVASVAALERSGESPVRRASDAPRGTVAEGVLKVTVSYADLGVRPKSTIRILSREGHAKDAGFLPELSLTLR